MSKPIVYTEPWRACTNEEKLALNEELAREITDEHPLAGTEFHAVALHAEKSQVLFRLKGAVFDWVVVYLTMKGHPIDDDQPDVDFYISRREWVERCMKCPWC